MVLGVEHGNRQVIGRGLAGFGGEVNRLRARGGVVLGGHGWGAEGQRGSEQQGRGKRAQAIHFNDLR
ncbi:hypothetical protein RZS08_39600, partial [Arthrospira platensis SPKY1]|nr:hypothetical protein [Arthrospira platensis SPKY1]